MKNVFDEIKKNRNLEPSFKNQMLNNAIEIKEQINEIFERQKFNLNKERLIEIYFLVENFSDENEITIHALNKLCEYYINNANSIVHQDGFFINIFLDMIDRHSEIFKDIEMFRKIIAATYPLLLINNTYNDGSDIDIAKYKYFDLLCSNIALDYSISFINRFIHENPNNPYVAIAKEKIEENNF